MVQQARVLAAALGDEPAAGRRRASQRLFARLERRERRAVARLRSARRAGRRLRAQDRRRRPPTSRSDASSRTNRATSAGACLYRVGALDRERPERLVDVDPRARRRRTRDAGAGPPAVAAGGAGGARGPLRLGDTPDAGAAVGDDVQRRAGAPRRHDRSARSSRRSRRSASCSPLYDIRLRIFEIVVASLVAAALLTALAATTIVRPLGGCGRRRRRSPSGGAASRWVFPAPARADEIGDLARALGRAHQTGQRSRSPLQSFAPTSRTSSRTRSRRFAPPPR